MQSNQLLDVWDIHKLFLHNLSLVNHEISV